MEERLILQFYFPYYDHYYIYDKITQYSPDETEWLKRKIMKGMHYPQRDFQIAKPYTKLSIHIFTCATRRIIYHIYQICSV